jgi:hypothetical protein
MLDNASVMVSNQTTQIDNQQDLESDLSSNLNETEFPPSNQKGVPQPGSFKQLKKKKTFYILKELQQNTKTNINSKLFFLFVEQNHRLKGNKDKRKYLIIYFNGISNNNITWINCCRRGVS